MNKTKHKLTVIDDGVSEIRATNAAEHYNAPNEYAGIPEYVGAGEFDENAKWEQRRHDNPRVFGKLQGNRTVNEMADQADDNTNFLGYCNDN